MTTNDKPVCYQCQVLLGRGMEGPWLSYDTAAERDARVAEHLREGRACYMRDLYDRPQPAAPQVPDALPELGSFAYSQRQVGYRLGWNDCRAKMLATPPAAKPAQPKPAGEAVDAEALAKLASAKPKYTYGHCPHKQLMGGCPFPNVQCNYPDCDRRLSGQEG